MIKRLDYCDKVHLSNDRNQAAGDFTHTWVAYRWTFLRISLQLTGDAEQTFPLRFFCWCTTEWNTAAKAFLAQQLQVINTFCYMENPNMHTWEFDPSNLTHTVLYLDEFRNRKSIDTRGHRFDSQYMHFIAPIESVTLVTKNKSFHTYILALHSRWPYQVWPGKTHLEVLGRLWFFTQKVWLMWQARGFAAKGFLLMQPAPIKQPVWLMWHANMKSYKAVLLAPMIPWVWVCVTNVKNPKYRARILLSFC